MDCVLIHIPGAHSDGLQPVETFHALPTQCPADRCRNTKFVSYMRAELPIGHHTKGLLDCTTRLSLVKKIGQWWTQTLVLTGLTA